MMGMVVGYKTKLLLHRMRKLTFFCSGSEPPVLETTLQNSKLHRTFSSPAACLFQVKMLGSLARKKDASLYERRNWLFMPAIKSTDSVHLTPLESLVVCATLIDKQHYQKSSFVSLNQDGF